MAEWYTCLPAGRRGYNQIMFFVYILQSIKTGEFYKGLTDNLDRRLNEHSNGESKSTKVRLPLRLIHVEICESRQEARKVEKFFKSGYGREVIDEIAGMAEWYTR